MDLSDLAPVRRLINVENLGLGVNPKIKNLHEIL